ncbi:MAG: ribosome silencing factor [Solirubrobacterales bacterium]|nr:ribosome silencing factor [Solirubrobacterales bacterium]
MSSEALARRIAAIADAKLGTDLVALDMRGLVGYTDFLVLCTVRNERQGRSINEDVRRELKPEGLTPARVEGLDEGEWVLIDYLDCILHVMTEGVRERYRLEQLWGEAARLDLDLQAA